MLFRSFSGTDAEYRLVARTFLSVFPDTTVWEGDGSLLIGTKRKSPLVLRPDAVIVVQPEDAPEEVLVTVDGQVGASLGRGHVLTLRRAERPVRIVRFPGTSFVARLRRKLRWGGLADRDE